MTTTFDFEKDIADLESQLEKAQATQAKGKVDLKSTIEDFETQLKKTKKHVYANLSGWQKVQISRHPERPYTLDYIENICSDFIELHGDRHVKDDKAIVGGFGCIDGQTYMIIGQQREEIPNKGNLETLECLTQKVIVKPYA